METIQVVLGAIFGSSVATAILNYFLGERRDRNNSKRSAAYLAQKIAFLMESYAIQIARALGEHDTSFDSGGHHGEELTRVPAFPELPESPHYEKLDLKLLDRILDFPDHIRIANGAVSQLFDHSDGFDAIDYATKATNGFAVRAIEIAAELRTENDLPIRNLEFDGYNIGDWLRQRLSRASS